MFIWLSDVTEELGPTHLTPLSVSEWSSPPYRTSRGGNERPTLYEQETTGSGSSRHARRLQHRHLSSGDRTECTRRLGRFSIHASYRRADNTWTSRHSWGGQSFHPDWQPFVEQATLSQLFLFAVPSSWPPVLDLRNLGGCRTALSGSGPLTVARALAIPGLRPLTELGHCHMEWVSVTEQARLRPSPTDPFADHRCP